jgi:hypothetical protein
LRTRGFLTRWRALALRCGSRLVPSAGKCTACPSRVGSCAAFGKRRPSDHDVSMRRIPFVSHHGPCVGNRASASGWTGERRKPSSEENRTTSPRTLSPQRIHLSHDLAECLRIPQAHKKNKRSFRRPTAIRSPPPPRHGDSHRPGQKKPNLERSLRSAEGYTSPLAPA